MKEKKRAGEWNEEMWGKPEKVGNAQFINDAAGSTDVEVLLNYAEARKQNR